MYFHFKIKNNKKQKKDYLKGFHFPQIFTSLIIFLFITTSFVPIIPGNETSEESNISYNYINSSPIPPQNLNPIDRNNLASKEIILLDEVPTSEWTYGCTATSAGMLFGYYDRRGYSNMYTGPTNGGICPLTDLGQATPDHPDYPNPGSCYIIATEQGLDGISTTAHVDDYWISQGSDGPDPWDGNWNEHDWDLCAADFLGTNQWIYDVDPADGIADGTADGGTYYWSNSDGTKLYDYIPSPYVVHGTPTACCHGLKLFAESRGYTVTTNYNQLTNTPQGTGDSNTGFTFTDYKNEIDNNRPVMTHWTSSSGGHTMLGVGYDNTNPNDPIIYFHNTWDNSLHSCAWTGTYSSTNFELRCVTILHLESVDDPPIANFTWYDADGPEPESETVIIFNANYSTDDHGIITYEWDWTSDGTYDYSSSTPYASHDYGDTNPHDCTLRVADNSSQIDTYTETIQANIDYPPTACFTWYDEDEEGPGTNIVFNASCSTDDNEVVVYEWDWNNDGDFDSSTSSPVISHDWNNLEPHNVTLKVYDNYPQTDSVTNMVQPNTNISLAEAVDNTNLTWTTGGNLNWSGGGSNEIVLDEGFENSWPPSGWSNDGWRYDLYGNPCEGEHWAYSWADGDVLTTPSILFGSESTTLTFQKAAELSSRPMDLEIYLDYDTPDQLFINGWYGYTHTDCVTENVNLPSDGLNHTISFVGRTNDFYGQILDDIVVETSTMNVPPPMDFLWDGQIDEWWFDGESAESGTINGDATSWIQTNVTGPGTLKFNWKVSSEEHHDYLRFFVDGIEKTNISGEVDWNETSLTFNLDNGPHILNWSYQTDGNWNTSGSNRGWIDKVEWNSDTPPIAHYMWSDADGSDSGTIIEFNASNSTDDNGIITYEWDWTSDGTYDYSSSTPFASHDYGDTNPHDCTLKVTDSWNQTDTFVDSVQSEVDFPPIADYLWHDIDDNGPETHIEFNASNSTDDNGIITYEWDWTSDGTYDYSSSTPFASHDYGDTNPHDCTLKVTDSWNQTDTFTDTVQAIALVELLDIDQAVQDRPFLVRHASDGDWGGAQNFTPTVTTITKVELYMKVLGTPDFDLTVELREDSIDGTLLDTITMTPGDFSSDWEWIELNFSDVSVTPGMNYFIVLSPPPSGVTNTFGYGWGYSLNNTYSEGSLWFTRTSGSFWLDLPDLYDFTFRSYGYN